MDSTIYRICSDVLCLLIFSAPLFVYNFANIVPLTSQGFFCNDESIRYPYRNSTLASHINILMALSTMFILAILIELYSWKSKSKMDSNSSNRCPHPVLCEVYRAFGYFVIGAAMNQFLTDLCKFAVGRLRPHFIDLCQPNVTCSDANRYEFIENFECLRTSHPLIADGKLPRALREARKSFPSGHASLAFYSYIYISCYLEFRLRSDKNWRLLRHVLQLGLVAWSLWVCCSRVFDYKHHPTDVLAGMGLGTAVAAFTVYIYIWCFKSSRISENRPGGESKPHAYDHDGDPVLRGWKGNAEDFPLNERNSRDNSVQVEL